MYEQSDKNSETNDNNTDHSNNFNVNLMNSTHFESRTNATDPSIPLLDVDALFNSFNIPNNSNVINSSYVPHKRVKRIHIFRPLFVYRQEKVRRQRIENERKFHNRKSNNGIFKKKQNEYYYGDDHTKPCCCCRNCGCSPYNYI